MKSHLRRGNAFLAYGYGQVNTWRTALCALRRLLSVVRCQLLVATSAMHLDEAVSAAITDSTKMTVSLVLVLEK